MVMTSGVSFITSASCVIFNRYLSDLIPCGVAICGDGYLSQDVLNLIALMMFPIDRVRKNASGNRV